MKAAITIVFMFALGAVLLGTTITHMFEWAIGQVVCLAIFGVTMMLLSSLAFMVFIMEEHDTLKSWGYYMFNKKKLLPKGYFIDYYRSSSYLSRDYTGYYLYTIDDNNIIIDSVGIRFKSYRSALRYALWHEKSINQLSPVNQH